MNNSSRIEIKDRVDLVGCVLPRPSGMPYVGTHLGLFAVTVVRSFLYSTGTV